MKKWLFALMLLFPTAGCGGGNEGEPIEGEAENEAEAEGAPETGLLVVSVEPALPAGTAPFQLYVDDLMMMQLPTGETAEVEVEAGEHDVRVVCPGYGYAVAGYEWASDGEPVGDWDMENVLVQAEATVDIDATVCQDLTGHWMSDDGEDWPWVYIYTSAGSCFTSNFFGFEVRGDEVAVQGGASPWFPILENGRRIEIDADGDGTPDYVFTRVD